MDKAMKAITAAGIGAGLMYFLDPDKGRRRRALMRDKMLRLLNVSGDAVSATGSDLSHRSAGLVAEMRSRFSADHPTDEVLIGRVRSKIGRVVSHPGAIEVTCTGGRVILSGPVLAREVGDLLSAVSSIRGVRSVDNRLETHEQAGDISALQGVPDRPAHEFELLQANWSPTARLLVGLTGLGLASYGIKRGGRTGLAASIGGGVLVARSFTNMPADRLIGIGAGRRAIDIHKTINVNAPVDEVYEFWRNVEHLSRIMSHVDEVKDLGNGRSRWTVSGPAGMPVRWEAVLTKMVPNRLLAWKSVEGSHIGNAGVVQFQPNADGGTRLDIRMSYNPPAGAIGNAVASLFGVDPKHALDDDMVRFKSLIEEGKTTSHHEKITLDTLQAQPAENEEIQPGMLPDDDARREYSDGSPDAA